MLGVALDVLELFACNYLSAADYGHLRAVVRAPEGAATQAALATMTKEIALVVEADPSIEARLERAQHHTHAVAE